MVRPFRPGLWEAPGGDLAASSRLPRSCCRPYSHTQQASFFLFFPFLFGSTLEKEVCTVFLDPKADWRIHTNLYPGVSIRVMFLCIKTVLCVTVALLERKSTFFLWCVCVCVLSVSGRTFRFLVLSVGLSYDMPGSAFVNRPLAFVGCQCFVRGTARWVALS